MHRDTLKKHYDHCACYCGDSFSCNCKCICEEEKVSKVYSFRNSYVLYHEYEVIAESKKSAIHLSKEVHFKILDKCKNIEYAFRSSYMVDPSGIETILFEN